MTESTDMKPNQNTQRAWQAFILGVALVSLVLFPVTGYRSALSPLESRLDKLHPDGKWLWSRVLDKEHKGARQYP